MQFLRQEQEERGELNYAVSAQFPFCVYLLLGEGRNKDENCSRSIKMLPQIFKKRLKLKFT